VKAAVLVFPGSNCDRDVQVALTGIGASVSLIWHEEKRLPDGLDLIVVPGGFAYGDYLRAGALAALSPIMPALREAAEAGRYILGICNGFQILTESGLLPGALRRNQHRRFLCKPARLQVVNRNSAFTRQLGPEVTLPVAHSEGAYQADAATLDAIEAEGRVAFRYAENLNGAARNIAGVLSANGRVLGLMPHPERASDPLHGRLDGRRLFESILA